MNVAMREADDFFNQILMMRHENQPRQHGKQGHVEGIVQRRVDGIVAEKKRRQRQAGEREKSGQNSPSEQWKSAEKQNDESQREVKIVHRQRAQRSGDALAAVKTQLNRPDMPGDDREHGHHDEMIVAGEMPRAPNRERTFSQIKKQREKETGFAEDASRVFCADAARSEEHTSELQS